MNSQTWSWEGRQLDINRSGKLGVIDNHSAPSSRSWLGPDRRALARRHLLKRTIIWVMRSAAVFLQSLYFRTHAVGSGPCRSGRLASPLKSKCLREWSMISQELTATSGGYLALASPHLDFVSDLQTNHYASYGVMLSCSAIWGPWLSELYPPHLRSTAASIFNWGRVISMTAPLITAPLADAFGRAPVMSLASISFLAAAVIWLRMPETVAKRLRPAAV